MAFAIGTGFIFIWNILQHTDLAGSDFPVNTYWIAVVFALWYFPDLVVVGFGRKWGRWPQAAVLPVVLALVVTDLLAYGRIWDLPLAWGVFLFTEFVYGFFALSFFLAATLAVPG